ncbi:MAG: MarR family transcriptional regulator [Chloroflexales bacterium]|nr:MarR family transcriptional regulator [Chloroflexales bacterium]
MNRLTQEGQIFTELIIEIFRLNGLLLEAGDELTRPVGLSSARWQVLGIVEHGPIPVAHIARAIGLTRQGVQQTADALEREGFVEYLDNPHHRRAKLVSLTAKGRKALDYVEKQQAEWANAVAGGCALASLRNTVEVLRRLRESLAQTDPSTQTNLRR